MFKKYLRIQPAPIQLIVFLTFWFVLMMLSIYISQAYISWSSGVPVKDLAAFLEKDFYQNPNLIFVSNALFALTTFLLPAAVYAYLADPRPVQYLGVRAPGRAMQVVWVVVLAISLIFVISPLGQWIKALNLGSASKALDERRELFIMSYLRQGDALTVLRSLLLIALVPAICEELLFRGVLMKFVYTFSQKWWLAIGASALVFAGFHASISEFLPIFLAGIVLGLVYYYTSSLLMNILLHFLFNGIQVVAGMSSNPDMEKQLDAPGTLIGMFCAATVIVLFCIYRLRKTATPLPDSWSVVVPRETAEAPEG